MIAPRSITERDRSAWASLLLILAVVSCNQSSNDQGGSQGETPMNSPFAPLEEPLTNTTDRMPLGEWAHAEDYRMRASEVRQCEVEPYFAAPPGHEKLGVSVELESRSEREVPVNALHASLRDSAGEHYAPTLAGCRPSLPASRIARGEVTRGIITFEVPETAQGLVLQYEPFIVGRPPAPLRFDLGR